MFSKRSDGRLIKGLDPFFRLIPHIMYRRSESQIFYKQDLTTDIFDTYIKEKRDDGYEISYMTIIITALVRLLALRPSLNRFIINGRIYAHNDIEISLAVKKELTDEAEETTIKVVFDGTENIFEVNEKINDTIKLNKLASTSNNTDKIAKWFMSLPNFLVHFFVRVLMRFDLWNIMPKSLIEASPFHASAWITNIKSIKLNYLYHHLYDFGTASFFVAIGKTNNEPVSSLSGNIESKRVFTLGYTIDERMCDGFYLSQSLRIYERYLKSPELLEERLEKKIEDID
ncbi:MAG: 2-oxoglutarate dehydrogenase [Anaerofustis sp.]